MHGTGTSDSIPLSDVWRLSDRVTLLPVLHGSGDFAVAVRRLLLEHRFDCLAVPLPASFQSAVEAAVGELPAISLVLQQEPEQYSSESSSPPRDWTPDSDAEEGTENDDPVDEQPRGNYVPIDPCQPVIAAIRLALQERIPCKFIDLETARYRAHAEIIPDPYALKQVTLEQFATAVLPSIPRPPQGLHTARITAMAQRLRNLERQRKSILCLCSLWEWPWIRDAYQSHQPVTQPDEEVEEPRAYTVHPRTLLFGLGELPFITGLYERARAELEDDENLTVDGVKELLLATRQRYQADLKKRARAITPQLLSLYLKYVRNLALMERRLTPDLYTLAVAAQQMAGDPFAINLLETACEYPPQGRAAHPTIKLGLDQGQLPDGEVLRLENRLAGPPLSWRSLELKKRPEPIDQHRWAMRWNPFGQCSWPPEDQAIESFRTHVKDKALSILGTDLARSEKFTTSLRDGLDLRETLRNWHTGDLYVKVLPPARGKLDCVVMLFDSPADPREYPWRTTWMAEHYDESTLALFATNFQEEMVGPGIGLATYGGAVFLFPPRPIIDIWTDPRLDFANTLEERVLGAGCLHSGHRHVAVLSEQAPGAAFRAMAKRFGRKLVHVPLGHFSQATVQQLRMVHVLNGRQVRSYAAEFIRKA